MPALISRPAKNHLRRTPVPRRARLRVYCQDYRCSHNVTMNGDQWPDHVRLTEIEDRFICTACGKRGATIRGDSDWDKPGALTGDIDPAGLIPLRRG